MVFAGISAKGVSSEHELSVSIASICQNMSWFLYFPKGTIAPLRMLSELSGTTLSRSISFTVPSPLHRGHAPSGELNENMLGAGSLYAMPVTGSISFFEKLRIPPVSLSRTIMVPSPCLNAVFMVLARRSSSASLTSILSTTTSILWFLYLSTFMPSVISVTVPSTLI